MRHRYEPWGAAREAFESREGEFLLSGPAGTGKSRSAMEKLHIQALKYPRMRGLIVRKTLASLGSTALVTWREHVAAEALASREVRWYGGSPQESPQYQYRNGSTIAVGGMDKATRIMSSEYDVAYIQEAIELTEGDWEAISTRMRNGRMPYQQMISDTNPDAPTHWLKARCDRGDTQMLFSRHEDNPVLFNRDGSVTERGAAYMARLDKLTGVRYYRLRKGMWVAAEGVIYEDWDPAVHLVDWFRPPDSWTRWWVIDFGYTNAFVLQCWAEDPDGRLYLYREIYRTRRTVDDHCDDILGIVSSPDPHDPHRRVWHEPQPRAVICDHDAEGREVFRKRTGLSTRPAVKGVAEGIQSMQGRLKPAGDGRPRLFIMRDALVYRDPELADARLPTCTAEEIPGYVWQRPGSGAASQALKEVPLKENDHGCLVAGTLVETERGPVPIELVRAGDRVWTRAGLRPVLAAGMTSPDAAVWRVEVSSGEVLEGTADHPVWVEGRGWVRMDALRYSDRLAAWEGVPLRTSNQLGSAASSTGVTRTPRHGLTAGTSYPASVTGRSTGSGGSTRRSGRLRTGRYPRATKSTTGITTTTTTPWTTSNASPSTNTGSATATSSRHGTAARRGGHTWKESGRSQWRGTARRRGWSGTAGTPPRLVSATASGVLALANSAALPMRRPTPESANVSVRTTASRRGGARAGSTTSSAHAHSAARSSPPIATRGSGVVGTSVLGVSATGVRRPVFNLTVAGRPEFFASGVLVHNCDAMRYLCAERDSGRPGIRVL